MATAKLIAYLGEALILLACAVKIFSADRLTLRAYGVEIKAENALTSEPPAKAQD
jgi:hypothetical protein